ncbi:MAG: hypothetical protein QM770_00780 [Tepidisphaeraceae bacterium]
MWQSLIAPRSDADTLFPPCRGIASESEQALVELPFFTPSAEAVELLADWLHWKPLPMTRGADGWWRTQAKLDDGTYEYRFRVTINGRTTEMSDPYTTPPDGTSNSRLHVKDGRRLVVR